MKQMSCLLLLLLSACPAPKPQAEASPRALLPTSRSEPAQKEDAPPDNEEDAEREKLHQVDSAEIWGETLPSDVGVLVVDEEGRVERDNRLLTLSNPDDRKSLSLKKAWMLAPRGEVYMALLSPVLAVLDDLGASVWLRHAEAQVAFEVSLKDEPAFQKWLADVVPGRVRLIQRADGLELSTVFGKVVGSDANGPSVPNRGGQIDLANARQGLLKLRQRFAAADEVGFVPSSATELQDVAHAMSANYRGMGKALFPKMFLVYRRVR